MYSTVSLSLSLSFLIRSAVPGDSRIRPAHRRKHTSRRVASQSRHSEHSLSLTDTGGDSDGHCSHLCYKYIWYSHCARKNRAQKHIIRWPRVLGSLGLRTKYRVHRKSGLCCLQEHDALPAFAVFYNAKILITMEVTRGRATPSRHPTWSWPPLSAAPWPWRAHDALARAPASRCRARTPRARAAATGTRTAPRPSRRRTFSCPRRGVRYAAAPRRAAPRANKRALGAWRARLRARARARTGGGLLAGRTCAPRPQLSEHHELIWNDGVAPETAIDFDAVKRTVRLRARIGGGWGGGVPGGACLARMG